ncbi:MAG: hypothetical protein BGO55_10700 [Sphingobacteriales bacterium 50-39]|nr:hypothetical protein [Sphingobacteriales bacterium]OJW54174.1 MAG: hypothetical protein BGO55_10700 [Sphingobacteriales bacterium 50-39]
MNKLLLHYLFLLTVLSSCRHASSSTHKGGSDTISLTEVAEKTPSENTFTDLDSSMVSLKTFRSLSLESAISQVWEFEDADKVHWNAIFWDSATDTRQYPELALFPDHSALLNPRCGLKIGTWNLDKENGEMSLQWKDGSADLFIVRQRALRQMELLWHRRGDIALVRLKSDAITHKDMKNDPYYPANNTWRIRPAIPETHDQLRRRVKGCIHWYSLFFLDNHLRQKTDISYSGLPSCFEWYNGGIGMKAKQDLDKSWKSIFYSEDQAFTAYDLIADELGKHGLKWPEHPTSWVEQEGQVLEQLAGKF